MSEPLIIDRFIAHHKIPPASRYLFVDRFGDKINEIDPAVAWGASERKHPRSPTHQTPSEGNKLMAMPPKALTPAEVMVDLFVKEFRLPPTCRLDLLGRFRDLIGVVDESVAWDLMEKTLNDDSDQGMGHLRQAARIVVPFELAEAACGAAPTLKARGELMSAVGSEVYLHTLRQWGASASNLKPGKPPTTDDDEKVSLEKPAKKKDSDSKAGPFSENFKGTDEQRAQEIAGMIRSLGCGPIAKMATAAKRDLAGRPLIRKTA